MKQGRSVEITCPKCSKETEFNVTDAISCEHCKSSFSGLRLAVKKALLPTVGALALAGYAGHKLDDLLEPNRYPLESKRPAAPPLLSIQTQRQQLIDPAIRPGREFFQCVFEPGRGFDVVQLGRSQQALDGGGTVAGAF